MIESFEEWEKRTHPQLEAMLKAGFDFDSFSACGKRTATPAKCPKCSHERCSKVTGIPDHWSSKQRLQVVCPNCGFNHDLSKETALQDDGDWNTVPDRFTGHCKVTGNACGTDTWAVGHPCACDECQCFLSHHQRDIKTVTANLLGEIRAKPWFMTLGLTTPSLDVLVIYTKYDSPEAKAYEGVFQDYQVVVKVMGEIIVC